MKMSALIRMLFLVPPVILQATASGGEAEIHHAKDTASTSKHDTLYASDFSSLVDGDFPPDLTFRGGSMQIGDSQGGAMLRFEGGSWFHVPLAADLPESFVIEFDYYTNELYAVLFVSPFDAKVSGQEAPSYSGYRQGQFNFFSIAHTSVGAAVDAASDAMPRANARNSAFTDGVVPIRLEARGNQAKIVIEGDQAVLLPSATIHRTDVVEFLYASMGAPGYGYIGSIRIRARLPVAVFCRQRA